MCTILVSREQNDVANIDLLLVVMYECPGDWKDPAIHSE